MFQAILELHSILLTLHINLTNSWLVTNKNCRFSTAIFVFNEIKYEANDDAMNRNFLAASSIAIWFSVQWHTARRPARSSEDKGFLFSRFWLKPSGSKRTEAWGFGLSVLAKRGARERGEKERDSTQTGAGVGAGAGGDAGGKRLHLHDRNVTGGE